MKDAVKPNSSALVNFFYSRFKKDCNVRFNECNLFCRGVNGGWAESAIAHPCFGRIESSKG